MRKIFTLEIYSKTKQGVILSFLILVIVIVLLVSIFYILDVNKDITATAITGIIIIFGYFLTHYLEIQRKQQEEQLKQYSELLKSIRIFLLEKNLSKEKINELIDKFQDAYLVSSLLISSEAYSKLKISIEMLLEFIKYPDKKENSDNFTNAQSSFINCLRKELVGGKNIEFNTYHIK